MGAQLRFGTAGATGGGWSCQPGTVQPSYGEHRHEPRWGWQARSPKTRKDPYRWNSLWSWGARVSIGGVFGEDGEGFRTLAYTDLYEPYSCDGEGTQSKRFFIGTCVDSADVVVANAIVQVYRTSDDLYLGEVQGHTDGIYSVPVDVAAGTPCYLVAYKAGSPDIAGTTVNTLTPTDVAGN